MSRSSRGFAPLRIVAASIRRSAETGVVFAGSRRIQETLLDIRAFVVPLGKRPDKSVQGQLFGEMCSVAVKSDNFRAPIRGSVRVPIDRATPQSNGGDAAAKAGRTCRFVSSYGMNFCLRRKNLTWTGSVQKSQRRWAVAECVVDKHGGAEHDFVLKGPRDDLDADGHSFG
jgi:hypothetical protein